MDAAVGTLLCMGVFHPQSMGLGGGFIMTVYERATGNAEVVDAREVAPTAASETMFRGKSRLTQVGGLAVAVPGEVRGYWEAHKRYGKLPWAELVQPAVNMCLEGVAVSGHLARALRGMKNFILKEPSLRDEFMNPTTRDVFQKGEIMRRPTLAKTLQRLAEKGGDDLYEGKLAHQLVQDLIGFGGIITMDDMGSYHPLIRKALATELSHGITMFTAPPPGGGAVFAHVLHILDGFGVKVGTMASGKTATLFVHRMAEALKFGFAQRSHLGDPAFVDVDELVARLMSKNFADITRHKIMPNQPLELDSYGVILHSPDDSGTAQVAVLAANGDAVSTTSTINTWVGAGIRSMQTGIIFNNEMDDFSSPNITNHFGVPPSPANYIRPGKRPLSSMCPAIFCDSKGDVVFVIGGAGGTRILSSVVQVTMRTLWMGESIKTAIDSRRVHHQLLPNELQVEEGFPEVLIKDLQRMGHKVSYHSVRGSSVVAIHRASDGTIYAASDFRKDGGAAGY